MEYFYSISGLILNVAVWSLFLFIIDKAIQNLLQKSKKKIFNGAYKTLIGLLVVFTTVHIAIDSVMIGKGFSPQLNYWYWNVDKEAKNWGVDCKGELILFDHP